MNYIIYSPNCSGNCCPLLFRFFVFDCLLLFALFRFHLFLFLFLFLLVQFAVDAAVDVVEPLIALLRASKEEDQTLLPFSFEHDERVLLAILIVVEHDALVQWQTRSEDELLEAFADFLLLGDHEGVTEHEHDPLLLPLTTTATAAAAVVVVVLLNPHRALFDEVPP